MNLSDSKFVYARRLADNAAGSVIDQAEELDAEQRAEFWRYLLQELPKYAAHNLKQHEASA